MRFPEERDHPLNRPRAAKKRKYKAKNKKDEAAAAEEVSTATAKKRKKTLQTADSAKNGGSVGAASPSASTTNTANFSDSSRLAGDGGDSSAATEKPKKPRIRKEGSKPLGRPKKRNPDGSLVHPPKLPKVKKPVLLQKTEGQQRPTMTAGGETNSNGSSSSQATLTVKKKPYQRQVISVSTPGAPKAKGGPVSGRPPTVVNLSGGSRGATPTAASTASPSSSDNVMVVTSGSLTIQRKHKTVINTSNARSSSSPATVVATAASSSSSSSPALSGTGDAPSAASAAATAAAISRISPSVTMTKVKDLSGQKPSTTSAAKTNHHESTSLTTTAVSVSDAQTLANVVDSMMKGIPATVTPKPKPSTAPKTTSSLVSGKAASPATSEASGKRTPTVRQQLEAQRASHSPKLSGAASCYDRHHVRRQHEQVQVSFFGETVGGGQRPAKAGLDPTYQAVCGRTAQ
jgi:hypothetical protein